MPIIYALANQKGGVGKTTTAVNLGAYLAGHGQRVLLVDIDPQANATSSLGVDKRSVPLSTYDVLVGDVPFTSIVDSIDRFGLELAPSAPALAGATVELVGTARWEHRLHAALTELSDEKAYDYVLIDCPPSLGILTVGGLTAATNGVIIPVQCEYLALEGLSQLARVIRMVRRALNPHLALRGLLMTMYDARTNLSQQVVDEVRQHFRRRVFHTIIPRSVRISEAPSFGVPISVHAPRSAGAQAYAALAKELLIGDGRYAPASAPADRQGSPLGAVHDR
ncbi:MAG: ParA family protein [Anaerolineae bacterium]|jgi:chromosome partitioning protein